MINTTRLLTHRGAGRTVRAGAGSLCRHPAAFIGTASARRGALTAVIHIVPFAFFSARIADIGAGRAYRRCELATTTHESNGCSADLGTVEIAFDAVSERFHIVFF